MTSVIYSGKCVVCGHMSHRPSPFIDGERVGHSAYYYDHNGLAVGRVCSGVTVSVMGRTSQQVCAITAQYRKLGAGDAITGA